MTSATSISGSTSANGFLAGGEIPRTRAWLAIAAGTIGGFMALLDTSIANSALPVIQGEIGATRSEATWIGTAYLTTEIIVIPLVAWLERLVGMRRFLFLSAVLFTFFSIVCGSATDLTTMIIGRLGQGLSGGMMMPTAYSLIGRLLPRHEQARGIAIISVPILLAPIIGPLLGGWLTENYSWHYAFFINVPICMVLVALLFLGMPATRGDRSDLTNADWFGVVGMIIGLGSLTLMLEEGHRQQWFDSTLIWQLAGGVVLGAILIAIGQFRPGRPVLRLALLRDRSQAAAMAMLLVGGAIMFCILFLVPQFLIVITGYNAMQAGQVILYSGISSTMMMFVYQPIMKGDLRLVVGLSMATLAFCSYITSSLTADVSGQYFIIMQVLMGASLSMVAIPLQQLTISMVAMEDVPEMTSLVTIFRNIGGAIGLAALASFQDQRLEFHHWRLHEGMIANDPQVAEAANGWSAMLGGGEAGQTEALRLIDAGVMRDALVMTFNDLFLTLAVIGLAAVPLCLLLRPRLPAASHAAPVH